MQKLLRVNTAINRILAEFQPLPIEPLETGLALGRVLGSDVLALYDLPYFDNSTMDGYVLRAEDTLEIRESGWKRFEVFDEITPGVIPNSEINQDQAARILTGAMIPIGGNAVIPVEETNIKMWEFESTPTNSIIIKRVIKKGENIRYQGDFVKTGDLLLKKGNFLRPQDIGIIASQGISRIEVHKRPRIGMFSTGNELLHAGATYEKGMVYESNSQFLEALIQKFNCECIRLETINDNEKNIRSALDDLVKEGVDLIITSGGVSMGAYDYVRYVIEKEGRVNYWRVNMRPGKPLLFGSYKEIPFIGLPGNPVSAFIGFIIFVKPVLQKLMGLKRYELFNLQVHLTQDIKSDGRESYLRALIKNKNGEWFGKPLQNQDSGNLFSLVNANALVKIPQGVNFIAKNSIVEGVYLDEL